MKNGDLKRFYQKTSTSKDDFVRLDSSGLIPESVLPPLAMFEFTSEEYALLLNHNAISIIDERKDLIVSNNEIMFKVENSNIKLFLNKEINSHNVIAFMSIDWDSKNEKLMNYFMTFSEITGGYVVNMIEKEIITIEQLNAKNDIAYLTEAPTEDNTNGRLKFVVLNEEPITRYSGYIYIINE